MTSVRVSSSSYYETSHGDAEEDGVEVFSLDYGGCTCASLRRETEKEMKVVCSASPPLVSFVRTKEGAPTLKNTPQEEQASRCDESCRGRQYCRQNSVVSVMKRIQCVFGCLLACRRRR
jgi:hypothetical protein